MIEQKISHALVLKALPDSLPHADAEMWAYAVVETKDREGDVMRVDGVSLELHRAESPIKVFGSGHAYKALPDGTFPLLGQVREFKKTTTEVNGKAVPALAARIGYAKEADGNLTAYAMKCKSLFDAGTLDSFSVGFQPTDIEPLKGGRYDIKKCVLAEVSACAIPVNPYAVRMKALRSALGEDFDADAFLEERIVQLLTEQSQTNHLIKSLVTRLDDIESAVVAKSEGAAGPTRQPKSQPDLSTTNELVAALLKRLA